MELRSSKEAAEEEARTRVWNFPGFAEERRGKEREKEEKRRHGEGKSRGGRGRELERNQEVEVAINNKNNNHNHRYSLSLSLSLSLPLSVYMCNCSHKLRTVTAYKKSIYKTKIHKLHKLLVIGKTVKCDD